MSSATRIVSYLSRRYERACILGGGHPLCQQCISLSPLPSHLLFLTSSQCAEWDRILSEAPSMINRMAGEFDHASTRQSWLH